MTNTHYLPNFRATQGFVTNTKMNQMCTIWYTKFQTKNLESSFQMGHSSSPQASTEHQVLQVWTHITIPYSNPFRNCCLNIIFRILANTFLSQMFGKIFLGDKHYNAMELSALEIFWPKSC